MTHPSPEEFIRDKSAQWKLNRTVTIRGNGSEGRKYEREAFTFMPETGSDQCVYTVERLSNPDSGTFLRWGYWVVSRHGAMSGRWVWGRFAPMIGTADMRKLMERAVIEKTLI